jgi:hypothetical protein
VELGHEVGYKLRNVFFGKFSWMCLIVFVVLFDSKEYVIFCC